MRKSRLTVVKVPGSRNSLHSCFQAVPAWRVIRNYLIISLAKIVPVLGWKNVLYRALGMKVGRDAAVGLSVMFDVFWPEQITLADNCLLGYNVTVLAHEFLIDEYRVGPTTIGAGAMIGANATILAGVTVGEGAVVGAGAVVTDDVLPRSFVAGVPARVVARDLGNESIAWTDREGGNPLCER